MHMHLYIVAHILCKLTRLSNDLRVFVYDCVYAYDFLHVRMQINLCVCVCFVCFVRAYVTLVCLVGV